MIIKMARNIFVVAFVMICAGVSYGADVQWSAQWVGPADAVNQPNAWLCYRKELTLDKLPASATARIACDSKYWLWINGQMVVFEGQLKRGPNPRDTYYDTVDLTGKLQSGKNTIAILLWYWGRQGFSHNSSGQGGLLFEMNCDQQKILSDNTWKVIRHSAYGDTGDPKPNFRLSESNIRFDARQDMPRWQQGGYDDSAWQPAKAYGRPPVAPWGKLVERIIGQWKNSGLRSYESQTEKLDEPKGQKTIIVRLPYNAQITPYLKVKAPAGQTIDIRTDDYLISGQHSVRAEYITCEGVQEYESFGWMNGHEVHYTMPATVEVLELSYRETGYNADFTGAFRCNDDALNTLWEKARRTLYITMRDNYMDCPDRERGQWWGDMVNEMGEAFYVFDAVKGPQLARKGIYELAGWQRDDKVMYSPVPAGLPTPDNRDMKRADGTWYKELPPQILASVGWYGFWTYYWYTADRQTMVDVYPAVRDYLTLWQLGDNGLVIHRPGEWDWSDWGDNIDVAVLDNAWYYLALKGAVEMARLTGNDADIPAYEKTMASIQAHFNETFWKGGHYQAPGYTGQIDDRANAMAVVAGLAAVDYYPALKQVLATHYHASPYMEKYVLEALYLMDAPQQAVERMKKRWASQIASPLTTLWEGWSIGGGTYNHAWSGGALTVLCQYAAGVSPSKAGFAQVDIMPQLGPLQQIETTTPLPQGNLHLILSQQTDRFEMKLTSPVPARLGIPRMGDGQTISVNGQSVYQQGKAGQLPAGLEYLRADDHRIYFMARPGDWTVTAR